MTTSYKLTRRDLLAALGIEALCALTASAHAAPENTDAIARAVGQFRVFHVGDGTHPSFISLNSSSENTPEPERAEAFTRALRPDGTWPDIDYASKSPSQWPPDVHCSRMVAMAARAAMPKTDKAASDSLRAAVHTALGYWIAHDPQCPNWWYNQIGIPKHLGPLALLMGDQLTPAEFTYITHVALPRSVLGGTGQNRVWFANDRLMLGLLTGDAAQLTAASAALWDEVKVTQKEGIQPDSSFQQHGPQQQFGNYGMGFAVEICRWATILRDTPWALPPGNLEAFRGFLLDGENWTLWRGRMDISACGRQIAPGNTRRKAETIALVMQAMQAFDTPRAADYAASVSRNAVEGNPTPNDLIGSRVFWRSDYAVHRSANRCATLKLHSARTIGTEAINNENLSGYYLADGALYLYGRGDEYEGIFPAWDWRRLPGTTCPQHDGPLPPPQREKPGTTFVGGVTDGQVSAVAFDLNRDGLTARKAYFFDGDEIVCLGAGITQTGASSPEVVTTINQCLFRGGSASQDVPDDRLPDAKSLQVFAKYEYDGLRYSIVGGAADNKIKAQTGNWNHVFRNPLTPKEDVTCQVYSLSLSHGVNPKDASYAYIVGPSGKNAKAKILANTSKLQAVQLSSGLRAFIFWEPGTQQTDRGGWITADQPCVVLEDPKTGNGYVADPTQKLSSIQLHISRTPVQVTLPTGGNAGRSQPFRLDGAWVKT